MKLFSFAKKKPTLNPEEKTNWPIVIAEYYNLTKTQQKILEEHNKQLEKLEKTTEELLKPELLTKLPERARDISEQHAKRIYEQAQKTRERNDFTNLFTLEEDLQSALDNIAAFKQITNKNFSALKEYLGEELQTIREYLAKIEDSLIKASQELAQTPYEKIRELQTIINEVSNLEKKREKYKNTLNKYLADKHLIEEKEDKHNKRITEQEDFVRDKEALEALTRVKEIEVENAQIAQKYSRLVFDTKHYILKNTLTINQTLKELFDEVHKDPLYNIQKQLENIKKEFIELSQTLAKLEAPDNKHVVERLNNASKELSQDAHTIQENTTQLHTIKKTIMHDIAVINIYEQEQFLIKTNTEKARIQEKIDVLAETLEELDAQKKHDTIQELLVELDFATPKKEEE